MGLGPLKWLSGVCGGARRPYVSNDVALSGQVP